MNAHIFIKRSLNSAQHSSKCIFKGDLPFVPRVGDSIVVLEGFCAEPVGEVIYSIHNNHIEIHLDSRDQGNEYPEVPVL